MTKSVIAKRKSRIYGGIEELKIVKLNIWEVALLRHVL